MDAIDLLQPAQREFKIRLGGVPADGWDLPTPCSEWTVRELVRHLILGEATAPEMLAGRDGNHFRNDPHLAGDNPLATWEGYAVRARDAMCAPGALDGTVVHPYAGEIPAFQLLLFRIVDNAVHAWDLAVSTGQDKEIDAKLVADLYALVEPFADLIAASGLFTPLAVPESLSTQTRLLGLFGRDDSWVPPGDGSLERG